MHTHKTIAYVAVIAVFVSACTAFAQSEKEYDVVAPVSGIDDKEEYLSQLQDFALESQSNIAHTKLGLLKKKWGLDIKSSYPYYYSRPNQYSLLDAVYGPIGSAVFDSNVSSELQLLTGERAIDESLQLGSINSRDRGESSSSATVALSTVEELDIETHPWGEMLEGKTIPEKPAIAQVVPRDHFFVYFDDVEVVDRLEEALTEIAGFGDSFFDVTGMIDARSKVVERLGVSNLEKLKSFADNMAFVSEDLSFVPGTNYALVFDIEGGAATQIVKLLTDDKAIHGEVQGFYVIASSQSLFDAIADTTAQDSMYSARDFEYAWTVLDSRRDGMAYFSEDFILKLVGPEYRINAGRRNVVMSRLEALQYVVLAYTNITGKVPSSLKQIADEGYIEYDGIVDPEAYSIDANGVVKHIDWGSLYSVAAVNDVKITTVSQAEKERYDRFREGYQRYWREFFDPIGIAFTVSDNIYAHTIILPLIDESSYNMMKEAVAGVSGPFDGIDDPLYSAPVLFLMHFDFDHILLSMYDSMSTSRNRAVTASMQSSVNNMRAQAELYFDSNGSSYSVASDCNSGIFGSEDRDAMDQSIQRVRDHEIVDDVYCRADGDSYIFAALLIDKETMYCIDSTGIVAYTPIQQNGTACPLERLDWSEAQDKIASIVNEDSNEPTFEERKAKVNEHLNELFSEMEVFKEEFDFFGLLGDEMQFHVGSGIPFELESVGDVDAVFAVKLADEERVRTFINSLYSVVAREFGGGMSFGMFRLSSNEPLKNEYAGQTYYVIPTGFVNLYYAYVEGYLVFTINQAAMNKVLDGLATPTHALGDVQERGLDYVGDEQNMLLTTDLTVFTDYKAELLEFMLSPSYMLRQEAEKVYAYMTDLRFVRATKLNESLLPNIPEKLVSVPVSLSGDRVMVGDVDYKAVQFGRSYNNYYGREESEVEKTDFGTLVDDATRTQMLEEWSKLRGFSVATNFTEDGLDVKVAVANSVISKKDARFSRDGVMADDKEGSLMTFYIIGGSLGALLLLLFVALLVLRKSKKLEQSAIQGGNESAQTRQSEQVQQPQEATGMPAEAAPPNPLAVDIDPALDDYIKNARALNMEDSVIRDNLVKNGWDATMVNKALEQKA